MQLLKSVYTKYFILSIIFMCPAFSIKTKAVVASHPSTVNSLLSIDVLLNNGPLSINFRHIRSSVIRHFSSVTRSSVIRLPSINFRHGHRSSVIRHFSSVTRSSVIRHFSSVTRSSVIRHPSFLFRHTVIGHPSSVISLPSHGYRSSVFRHFSSVTRSSVIRLPSFHFRLFIQNIDNCLGFWTGCLLRSSMNVGLAATIS